MKNIKKYLVLSTKYDPKLPSAIRLYRAQGVQNQNVRILLEQRYHPVRQPQVQLGL